MPVLTTTPAPADRLLGERIVLLSRELDDDVAADTCARLLLLAAEDPRRDVTLHVLSPGGSPVAAMTVHDTMRALGVDVVTVAHGSLAGPAPFLVAAGTPGKRFALPHTSFLLPGPGTTGTAPVPGAHPGDVRVRADHLDRRRAEIDELTARYCGGEPAAGAGDRWLTARGAVSAGLVDHLRGADG